ncbi:MAG: N-formylglutamate amidohydrolase, partial [Pseudomonadota bacterium]|nr:N-formylglutamate amidohydrolase [Pseudomonadota bacterium]
MLETPVHSFRKLAYILQEHEPDPFEVVNLEGSAPVVITCDHASNRMPEQLGNLGLSEPELSQHIAYDIGSAGVARGLSRLLDAPLVLSCYSRLVVDLNRHLGDPSSIPETSDEITVPGNIGLTRVQCNERVEELFIPYHNTVSALLEHVCRKGRVPVMLSIHSFTPEYQGFQRPWQVGVLWDRDPRIARPLVDGLQKNPELCVGENKPYHAREPVGYTMDVQAEGNGYPHALL